MARTFDLSGSNKYPMTSPDLAKSYAFNEATNVRPFSLTQSRTNYRVKVYNQQLFGSVSPRESVKFNHE